MKKRKRFKERMFGILFLALFVGIAFFASSVQADVTFSTPVVGQYSSSALEIGATFVVTVEYIATEGDATIDALQLDVEYDSGVLESPSVTGIVSGLSGSNVDTGTEGLIEFQKWINIGDSGFGVTNGNTYPIYRISFHVKEGITPASYSEGEFIYWRTPVSTYVYLKETGNDKTGTSNNNTYTVTDSYDPSFGGLEYVYDGNSVSADNYTGSRLCLNWTSNGSSASDLNSLARTHYSDGRLRYNIYRSTTNNPATILSNQIASATLNNTGTNYTYRDTGLSDVDTTYYYIVQAQDACTTTHNAEANEVIISGTPHDYTAPSNPSLSSIAAGDGQNTLSWSNPSDSDFAGVLIARSTSGTPSPTLTSASGNDDGDSYNVSDILSDGSEVIYVGSGTSKTDSGLTNGVTYYYSLYAFDTADSGPPRQQGYNYSGGTSGSQTPGVAPDDVSNLMALSESNVGDIALMWTNPDDLDGYGGALMVYCTDPGTEYSNWEDMTETSATDDPSTYSEQDVPIDTHPIPTTLTETSYTLSDLPTTETYYFKVFAYNIVPDNDPTLRQYADGEMVAAVPVSGGDVVLSFPLTLESDVDAGGPGINLFSMPFASPWYINSTSVSNAYELVVAINTAYGSNIVSSFGHWDAGEQEIVHIDFADPDNVEDYAADLTAITLEQAKGYQVYVTDDVTVTVTNTE